MAKQAQSFGEWLRTVRDDNNLTMSAVAKLAGVTVAAISKLESGVVANPKQDTKEKVEEAVSTLLSGGVSAFGSWLKENRVKRDLSVLELADKVGVSAQSIYNLENGKTQNPNQATRSKLEHVLGQKVPQATIDKSEQLTTVEGLGSLQEFDPHSLELIPSEAGVYVLYDISDRPVYVGRSANIRKRLAQHSVAFWYKKPIVVSSSYIRIDDVILRNQIEEILIRFLKSNAVINKAYVDRDLEQK